MLMSLTFCHQMDHASTLYRVINTNLFGISTEISNYHVRLNRTKILSLQTCSFSSCLSAALSLVTMVASHLYYHMAPSHPQVPSKRPKETSLNGKFDILTPLPPSILPSSTHPLSLLHGTASIWSTAASTHLPLSIRT